MDLKRFSSGEIKYNIKCFKCKNNIDDFVIESTLYNFDHNNVKFFPFNKTSIITRFCRKCTNEIQKSLKIKNLIIFSNGEEIFLGYTKGVHWKIYTLSSS